jgi:hypothetical protein
MSAEIGASQPAARTLATISCRHSASLAVGAVMRINSQPAFHNSSVCSTVASMSLVLVVVIDCTRIGLSPPMMRFPTRTGSVTRRMGEKRLAGLAR